MMIFGVKDFHRDYEDTWEWFEGRRKDGFSVNISRSHNWKTGNYDCPVSIQVVGASKELSKKAIFEFSRRISDHLGIELLSTD
jgi:hypothetical protein